MKKEKPALMVLVYLMGAALVCLCSKCYGQDAIGTQIRDRAYELKVSWEQISTETGFSLSRIKDYVENRVCPMPEDFKRFERVLKCCFGWSEIGRPVLLKVSTYTAVKRDTNGNALQVFQFEATEEEIESGMFFISKND